MEYFHSVFPSTCSTCGQPGHSSLECGHPALIRALYMTPASMSSRLYQGGMCRCYGCHYPGAHQTSDHKCGKCGCLGHGRVECGHPHKIRALYTSSSSSSVSTPRLGGSCRCHGCHHPHAHSTSQHTCGKCGRLGHGRVECGHPRKIQALYLLPCSSIVSGISLSYM